MGPRLESGSEPVVAEETAMAAAGMSGDLAKRIPAVRADSRPRGVRYGFHGYPVLSWCLWMIERLLIIEYSTMAYGGMARSGIGICAVSGKARMICTSVQLSQATKSFFVREKCTYPLFRAPGRDTGRRLLEPCQKMEPDDRLPEFPIDRLTN